MKILVFCHGLWFGGAQVSTLQSLRLLKDYADLKVVICENADLNFLSDLKSIGVPIYVVPYTFVEGIPLMDISKVTEIQWADIIYISDIEYSIAPLIKKLRDIPIIAHLHSYTLICPWWGATYGLKEVCLKKCSCWRLVRCKQLFNNYSAKWGYLTGAKASLYTALDFFKGPRDYFRFPFTTKTVNSIDGFIGVSKAVKEIYVSHISLLNDKPFEVIYQPLVMPPSSIEYSLGIDNNLVPNRIVYASGDNLVKGLHILLTALSILPKEIGCVELITTKGWSSKANGSIYQKFNFNSNVKITILDRLSYAGIVKLYAESKVVIMPSIWPEPFGRVAAEANLLGVPAIGSNIGGLPEIIKDGVTGFLSKPNDPNDLSEKIVKAFQTSYQRDLINRLTADKFNSKDSLDKIVRFIGQFV